MEKRKNRAKNQSDSTWKISIKNPLDVKKEDHSKLSKFSQQGPLYVSDNH